MPEVTADKFAELLKGKTIQEVYHFKYLSWPMCIERIRFTDGASLYMTGDNDDVVVDYLAMPGGEHVRVTPEDKIKKL